MSDKYIDVVIVWAIVLSVLFIVHTLSYSSGKEKGVVEGKETLAREMVRNYDRGAVDGKKAVKKYISTVKKANDINYKKGILAGKKAMVKIMNYKKGYEDGEKAMAKKISDLLKGEVKCLRQKK